MGYRFMDRQSIAKLSDSKMIVPSLGIVDPHDWILKGGFMDPDGLNGSMGTLTPEIFFR